MTEHEYQFYLKAVRSYKIGRNFTLLLMAFTLGSLITTFFGFPCIANVFSATVFFITGQIAKQSVMEVRGDAVLANCGLGLFIFIGIVVLALFFIFFKLSRKKRWAYIGLIVLFSIDLLIVLLLEMSFTSYIFDIILHVISLVLLVKGVINSKTLEDDFDDGVATTEADVTEIYNILKQREKTQNS